jgi:hypothetical protein
MLFTFLEAIDIQRSLFEEHGITVKNFGMYVHKETEKRNLFHAEALLEHFAECPEQHFGKNWEGAQGLRLIFGAYEVRESVRGRAVLLETCAYLVQIYPEARWVRN